ncbi:Histidinol-phosphate aminotransferase [Caldithrix abyssi DSM 13497]|uniref:Histidinol-phosphate aminotransferase n=1 Tax=Caldithrix abyssi DSM 13497 TaxID=880073 RepID=H1XRY4_CALAY|nr:histidinol-phosphate transaminase [Caldithrix abyssi]APF18473.1 hisC histidinol-phosphate aminotransferase [Caldithrix abyssi DSM 13497]EHO42477.1 Histidinol-phosphate aminotransferase [Caldithrix abyssi DSM 13497]
MPLVPQHIKDLRPYKPGKSIEELKRELGLSKIVKLASNENPIGVSPLALQAMHKALTTVNRYPSPDAYELRRALAAKYDVKIENVFTGNGSEGIIAAIMRTFLLDDEEAITSHGSFVTFDVQAQSRGIKVIRTPLKDYRLDLQAMAERITPKTKIIYLANPNNPTGTIFTVSEFQNFIKKVPERVLVILDEAYFEFAHDAPTYPDSMQYRLDNVITLRTFSKAYGLAGVRIGYGFAHEELIANLMKIKLTFEPNTLAQMAAVAAMEDADFLEQTLHNNRIGKQFLYDLFKKVGVQYLESYTNFVTIVFESEKRVNTLFEKLLKEGVIVRPLKSFGLPNCIRVSIGLPEENEFFAQKLKKVL